VSPFWVRVALTLTRKTARCLPATPLLVSTPLAPPLAVPI